MSQLGIVRNLDSLGRIVPPRAFLKELHINPGDPVEVTAELGQIVIRPHRSGCIFCGSELGVKSIHDVNVCRQCALEMPGVFGGTRYRYEGFIKRIYRYGCCCNRIDTYHCRGVDREDFFLAIRTPIR